MIMATDISNIELGEPGFLGALQNATTILLNDLSPEDWEEYAQAAVEGQQRLHHHIYNPGVCSDILCIYAEKHYFSCRMAASMHKQIIQDFQRQLFKTCGICTLVLTTYKGEDHDLNICL
jgi:hypothetical protein